MKQVHFENLVGRTIVVVDASCINRVIVTTRSIDDCYQYFWLDADVTHYGISCPTLYELTKEEATKTLKDSVYHLPDFEY